MLIAFACEQVELCVSSNNLGLSPPLAQANRGMLVPDSGQGIRRFWLWMNWWPLMDLNTCLPSTTYIEVIGWIKSTAPGTILPVNFTIIRYEVHYFPQWLALIHPSLLSWYSLWDSSNNNATLCSGFQKNQNTSLDSLWTFVPTEKSKHKAFTLRPQLSLQLTST